MLLHWSVTFWGNLAGSLFVVAIIFGYGNVFAADTDKSKVIAFATKKQVTPDFHHLFLRGIGCNWLVSLACFLAMQGRDLASKLVGIWFPIFGFVSLGFNHVVANMTSIPMGIWLGAPEITVGLYIWKGIITTLLENIIGGGLFAGTYYWYMYLLNGEGVTLNWMSESGTVTPCSGDVEVVAADKLRYSNWDLSGYDFYRVIDVTINLRSLDLRKRLERGYT
ncbi:formate/nitrite transporter, putative [Aspergillus lentulus]|uniref:Formate/nitrite transporter, putative n=1 Tax=Aspergillus lentulus TaxID=293939 RepID=A0AAN5YTZ5_ASPLE|nr:hypothetical protein CNMCM6069_001242 [Aspergillus lentulus]KAF4207442.1 hypothetical protein CNMCM8927_002847 [Aspergillus lentulus]GFF85996.1 formate/nitrite transporter, putative [Aspergillus lentulus]GFG09783.1 formate/nitrite transporter, putative [Aspergillus lentulus]